jgi:hypothetical protein
MSKSTNVLLKVALQNIEAIEKAAFIPIPAGQMPIPMAQPADPAAAGMPPAGAMPPPGIDPATGMPAGVPPEMVPPTVPVEAGPAGVPTDGQAPQAGSGPASAPPEVIAIIKEVVKQVLQEMGVRPGEGGEAKPAKKKSATERLDAIESALGQLGLPIGDVAQSDEKSEEGDKQKSADGMSSGSGQPAELSAQQLAGPLDPNLATAVGTAGLSPQASADRGSANDDLIELLQQLRRK